MELEGVQAHFAVTNKGLSTFMHKFHRIFDGEDVTGFVAIDPIDHGGQGCALSRSSWSSNQHKTFGARC